VELDGRTVSGGYRFGYQGSEKDDESKGNGNSYTTEFRQLDPRLGRWLSIDPKATVWVSSYVSMGNNPIYNTDILGDTVRTNKEGADNTNKAITSILDKESINPISYDSEKGVLKYDNTVDISKYTDAQKEVLGRYKILIEDTRDVNLKIVDVDEKIIDGKSLSEIGANGITQPYKYQDGKVAKLDVYVARNPIKYNSEGERVSEKKEWSNVCNLHELGGHSYLYITQSLLTNKENNTKTEEFHLLIHQNFKINDALWYKRTPVPIH
jgi:RHS repeat-associated protein